MGILIDLLPLTDYLTSPGRKVSPNTVDDYVDALAESFIFYPVERCDIVGKQLLKSNKKMYMVDLWLRNHILPREKYDLGFSVEAIVYFELLRRGFKVNIGKLGAAEVGFVAQKQGVLYYYQVTADMTSAEAFDREMGPLKSIRDNYQKTVLTLDCLTVGNYNEIVVENVLDWLFA
jgi:predicted AAA+ superfamily ATPase